jgi:rare lipoprotein A
VADLPPMAVSATVSTSGAARFPGARDDPWADTALVNPASAGAAASGAQTTGSSPSENVAGFWVQLGAFRERDGAEGLRARAASGLPSLASQLRVFSESGTNRLQAGPFPSRDAAIGAVSQVRETLGIAPMVVERR